MPDALPAYEPQLAAFHAAFRRELRRAVRGLPAPPAARVLDVPCGDGFYTAALARHFAAGAVTAADLSPEYLKLARRVVRKATRGRPAAAVKYAEADAYALPFSDTTFDVVWCAQSFITFDNGPKALREMARVARPGGIVAVLESDELHHVVLNWPVGLESSLQKAVADASRAKYGTPAKLCPARRIGRLMREAGLAGVRKITYAADRVAPFHDDVAAFLRYHFASTRTLVAGHLPADELAEFDGFTDPADAEGFFRREDAELTCLNAVYVGTKAGD